MSAVLVLELQVGSGEVTISHPMNVAFVHATNCFSPPWSLLRDGSKQCDLKKDILKQRKHSPLHFGKHAPSHQSQLVTVFFDRLLGYGES